MAKGLFNKKEINKLHESSNTLLTFQSAVEQFIEHLKLEGASPNYIISINSQLVASANELVDKFGLKYVHKLTEENAYSYRNYLLNRVKKCEIKRVTSFRILNDTKRLFKWLKRRKKISKNPWKEVESISVPKAEKAKASAPSVELINKLMAADYKHRFEFPVKEFMYGLFRTGARKEELLYLEVEDVDWDTGHWFIKPKNAQLDMG